MPALPANRVDFRPNAGHLVAACVLVAIVLALYAAMVQAMAASPNITHSTLLQGKGLLSIVVLAGLELLFLILLILRPPLLSVDDYGVWRRRAFGWELLVWEKLDRIRITGNGDAVVLQLFADDAPTPPDLHARVLAAARRDPRLMLSGEQIIISNRLVRFPIEEAITHIGSRAPGRVRFEEFNREEPDVQ